MELIISGKIKGNSTYINKQLDKLKELGIIDLHYSKKDNYDNSMLEKIIIIIEKHSEISDSIFSHSKKVKYVQGRMLFVHYAYKCGMSTSEIMSKMSKSRMGVFYFVSKFKDEIQFNKYFINKFIQINNEVEKILNHAST